MTDWTRATGIPREEDTEALVDEAVDLLILALKWGLTGTAAWNEACKRYPRADLPEVIRRAKHKLGIKLILEADDWQGGDT